MNLWTIQTHWTSAYLDVMIIKIVSSLRIRVPTNFVFSKMETSLILIPLVMGAAMTGIAPTRELVTQTKNIAV